MVSFMALREASERVVLHGVSWAEYERRCALRGEGSVPRITYLDGDMELMTPSRDHEQVKSHIGALVEAFAIDRGVELGAYGSWTLKAEVKQAGVEPDECYILGLDQRKKKVPDLAIEVIWTSGSVRKLEAYRRLGVREVWFWKNGELTVHVMRGRRFVVAKRSRALPALDLTLLVKFLDRPTLTQAVRGYREALAAAAKRR